MTEKKILKENEPCSHPSLVPYELAFAKKTYPNGYREGPEFDYSTTILNANVAHVKKYYCAKCKTIVKAPNVYSEKKD